MGHVPNIGRRSPLSSAAEELVQPAQTGELLGTLSASDVQKIVSQATEQEPPPPWETDSRYARHNTDARRFVSVPDTWELRWLSPRVIDQNGMRDWQAVAASDPRVKVHNPSVIAPDNTVRRGGDRGDVLCWMWRSWVASRRTLLREETAKRTRSARDRQQAAKDEINRGGYGRYVSVESAKHPTHTMGDGRTMTD